MEETSLNDIRKLLKTFGVKADEEITHHLLKTRAGGPLLLRITLEDLTDYGDQSPEEPLHLEVKGEIRR
ncbi:hypothetical protein FDZ74_13405 [bacterium]|nr:MAG: hypothetical protein FDZ74_13405 [bacterium]